MGRSTREPSQLVLGAAQLGMPYGIANTHGQPDLAVAEDILLTAWENGIRFIDTAQAYGDSEAVIGQVLQDNPQARFQVITKLSAHVDVTSHEAIESAVASSHDRLGQAPAAMMLHSFKQLATWRGILGSTLTGLKDQGKIGKIGVSVYQPNEFRQALAIEDIDWIQAPFNIFDQRLVDESLLEKARTLNRQVFLRSAFLQGLLVMPPESLPEGMKFAANSLRKWQAFCRTQKVAPEYAALQFVRKAAPDANVVIGCETAQQLQDNIRHWSAPAPDENFFSEIPRAENNADILIDPSRWPMPT